MNNHYAKPLIGFAAVLLVAGLAQAATPSKHVQNHCVADYKKFCSEWGIESKGLKNCMHKHGEHLTPACVTALVHSGEVSQAEVERRKSAKKN
jgi:hypothetical protein